MGGISSKLKRNKLVKDDVWELSVEFIMKDKDFDKEVVEFIFFLFICRRKVLEVSDKVLNGKKSFWNVEDFSNEVDGFIFFEFIWKFFDCKEKVRVGVVIVFSQMKFRNKVFGGRIVSGKDMKVYVKIEDKDVSIVVLLKKLDFDVD